MKFLKVLALNTIAWIAGVILFFYWVQWDLEKNPIPPNPDGSIPDSFMIWVFEFAIVFLLFLVLVNSGYVLARFLWRKFRRAKAN